MSKFTFTCDEGPSLIRGQGPQTIRTVTFEAVQFDTILQEFELFLKGCGFQLDGSLYVVDEFDQITETKEDIDPDGRC